MTEKNVEVLDKKTNQTSLHPYGLVVWSTGVAPQPLTKALCESLPEQNNKCVCVCACTCVVGTCVCACMHACVRACVCVCMHAPVFICTSVCNMLSLK